MRLWYRASVIGNKIYWGIKTGFNRAFVINGKQRADFINANSKNAEIIRPLAVGDDVRRWHVRDKDRYLIVTRIGVDMQRYPEIFEHLKQWENNLRRRSDQGNHWWELRSCDYYDAFDKPKIIYPDMAQSSRFTLDKKGYYFGNTTYFIPLDDLYLLGILNSNAFWGLCQKKFASFKGATLRFYKQDLLTLPIPIPTDEQRKEMERLVACCLESCEKGSPRHEKDIDLLADKLYGFSESSNP